ncbi:MAG: LacI family DNA-binding transcriptional regulator [Lachnospirales bacterium]
MSITAKELAALLGISPAAVSMALNGKKGVSNATRHRILAAAEAHGYDFTRIQEKQLPSHSYGTIFFIIYKKSGAIVNDTPFFSQLSEGINECCKAEGYHLNISYVYAHEDIPAFLSTLTTSGQNGVLLLGTEMAESDFEPFRTLSLPLVVLDTYCNQMTSDYVLINNTQGAFLATDHLIKHCQSQPGYLHSSYVIGNFEERANGFYQAIRAAGMSTSQSIVHRLTPSMDGAYADMLELLAQQESLANCYFADNDTIAAGALRALKEYGYRIPQDISIIGFDDLPLCNYLDPPLTTVQVSKQYMGRVAARRLIERIHEPDQPPIKIELSTRLLLRRSVL